MGSVRVSEETGAKTTNAGSEEELHIENECIALISSNRRAGFESGSGTTSSKTRESAGKNCTDN